MRKVPGTGEGAGGRTVTDTAGDLVRFGECPQKLWCLPISPRFTTVVYFDGTCPVMSHFCGLTP